MPGSGKSTVGVLLAKALCMDFIDTDLLIQKTAGKPLQKIITEDGLERFLAIENDVLINLNCKNTVIASGGSAVLSPDGIRHLRATGTTVYLEISYQTMILRINNLDTRGLVLRSGETLVDLYNQRFPLYDEYADKKINCDDRSTQDCVDLVHAALNRSGCAEKFFASDPAALRLYEIIERVILDLTKATIEFQKTQISFGTRRKFAWVWLPLRKVKGRPDHYVVLSLSLGRPLDSSRPVETFEPYPGRWMHHLIISQPADIDAELLAWLREAVAFADRPAGSRLKDSSS